MVYEVVGLAGAGKSTLVNEIERELLTNNIPTFRIGVDSFTGEHQGHTSKLFSKMRKVFGCFSPACITLFFFLMKELLCNKRKKRLKESIRELYIKIVYLCYLKRNYVKHRHDLVLVDEGALQSAIAISIFIGDEDPSELAKRIVGYFDGLFKFIIIKISVSDALERIVLRNRQSADIDFMSYEDLEDYLKKYDNHMKGFCKEYASCKLIEVCGSNDIYDSAMSVVSKILLESNDEV